MIRWTTQKSISGRGKGYYQGNRDRHTNQQWRKWRGYYPCWTCWWWGGGDGDEKTSDNPISNISIPVPTTTKIDFRFRYISIQVQQQQQQQTPKRIFVLPKRKKTGPLRRHQHHGRNGSGLPATATTKKTNRNNNNNDDDDCNTTDLIDLQDVCSKQVRQFWLWFLI